jgi:hypothetical protein
LLGPIGPRAVGSGGVKRAVGERVKNILINKCIDMETLRTFHILYGKVKTEGSVQKAFDQGTFNKRAFKSSDR